MPSNSNFANLTNIIIAASDDWREYVGEVAILDNITYEWASLENGWAITLNPGEESPTIIFDPEEVNESNLYEIALHEIGHALGLPHDDTVDAVMNTYGGSETGFLTEADIIAIQELYPPTTPNAIQEFEDFEDFEDFETYYNDYNYDCSYNFDFDLEIPIYYNECEFF